MSNRSFTILLIAVLFFLMSPISACSSSDTPRFKKTFSGSQPQDGDRIVFLGDSITHQCLYTQYVETYYYTRYPGVKLNFRNAGVSADKAADALERFDIDVTRYKPKYVTVLLGMNDGQYTYFRHSIFYIYKKGISQLLDRIAEIGAKAIAITPTIYDLRPALQGGNWVEPGLARKINYNAVLAFYGTWLRQETDHRGIGFADMFGPLNRITRQQRKKNPNFTMIKDAVHPGPDGQLVMALALLKGVEADPVVSSITVYREKGKWVTKADKGTLTQVSSDRIRFVFKAEGLPWVVPTEARGGFRIAEAGRMMSRETFRVVGLEEGNYSLIIDGTIVGNYTHLQLAGGVELQENTKTPQYRQALAVANLNKKRNDEVIRPMRNLWEKRKWKKIGSNYPGHEIIPLSPEAFKKWEKEFLKEVKSLEKKSEQMVEAIYRINRPKSHTYELVVN